MFAFVPARALVATWLLAGAGAAGCASRAADHADIQPARLLTDSVSFDFLPERGKSCYAALIEFVVAADGRPEPASARIVRTNWLDFGRRALSAVPTLRYEPALQAGRPVRQVVQWGASVALPVTALINTYTSRVSVPLRSPCQP